MRSFQYHRRLQFTHVGYMDTEVWKNINFLCAVLIPYKNVHRLCNFRKHSDVQEHATLLVIRAQNLICTGKHIPILYLREQFTCRWWYWILYIQDILKIPMQKQDNKTLKFQIPFITHSIELNVIQSVNVINVFLLNGTMCSRTKLYMHLCVIHA